MPEHMYYKAYGLVIDSVFSLPQVKTLVLSEEKTVNADVVIQEAALASYVNADGTYNKKDSEMVLLIDDLAIFHVTDGKSISVDVLGDREDPRLAVYLMGSCMGAVLHQRGEFPIHGSCVTDGSRSVLITGDSGAGKSTTAAMFLNRGWKLLSDDVTLVRNLDTLPEVVSSYPSQKLWQDSLDRYKTGQEEIHTLYARENNEYKYGVNVVDSFYEGSAPLSLIVRLFVDEEGPTKIRKTEGLTVVNQLMYNTYRAYMIEPDKRQRHFQRCVNLSMKVPMAYVIRNKKEQCAEKIYEMITDLLNA